MAKQNEMEAAPTKLQTCVSRRTSVVHSNYIISYLTFTFVSSSIVNHIHCCLLLSYLERLRAGLFSPVPGTVCFAGKLQPIVYAHTQSGYI